MTISFVKWYLPISLTSQSPNKTIGFALLSEYSTTKKKSIAIAKLYFAWIKCIYAVRQTITIIESLCRALSHQFIACVLDFAAQTSNRQLSLQGENAFVAHRSIFWAWSLVFNAMFSNDIDCNQNGHGNNPRHRPWRLRNFPEILLHRPTTIFFETSQTNTR